jgi:hypothetical protein
MFRIEEFDEGDAAPSGMPLLSVCAAGGVPSHALDEAMPSDFWDLTVELLHPWRETV